MTPTDKPTPDLPDEDYHRLCHIIGEWEKVRESFNVRPEYKEQFIRGKTRPSELRQAGVDGMDEIRRTVNAVLGMQLDYEGPWSLGVSKHTPPELYGAEIGRCTIKLLNHHYTQPAAQKTEGGATSMQILEVGKDQYGEPLTVMGKPNAVHALQTALASSASVDVVKLENEIYDYCTSHHADGWTQRSLAQHLAAKFPELVGGRE